MLKIILTHFARYFISLLFPSTGKIALIERMSPAEFAQAATVCLDELPQGIVSLFKYKDLLVREALWNLKYRGNARVAELFATLLYETIIETLSEEALYANFQKPLFVPIPLSVERLKERGWNQAKLVVEKLVKLNPEFEYQERILVKKSHTVAQTKLSRRERLKNLRGCFSVPPEKISFIQNRNIILIDDIVTTGSTLREARRALLESGARRVIAFTVAH